MAGCRRAYVSLADVTNPPLGRLKHHHDLLNKGMVQKVLINFDFNSLVGFSTQKIRHLLSPILSAVWLLNP